MSFIITIITVSKIWINLLGAPDSKEQKFASLIRSNRNTVTISAAENTMLANDIAATMRDHRKTNWGKAKHYDKYARLFVRHGRRWGVDPILVACVAMAESRYRRRPPALYRQKCINKMIGCSRPGPCYPRWKKICRKVKVNVAEVGMMQVLYYDKSTHLGYKFCTGKKLIGNKEQKQRNLRPFDIAICVGSYELSRWKKWALYGGYGRIRCVKKDGICSKRMTPKYPANVSFFQRYPKLRRFFWVSYYNWGSNRWKGNSYPRKVLWCYQSYERKIKELRKARLRLDK